MYRRWESRTEGKTWADNLLENDGQKEGSLSTSVIIFGEILLLRQYVKTLGQNFEC